MCAVVQNPIIGRAKNKLGGVVFQTWKGKNVLRSKPLTVANPKTDKQVAQRNKLSAAVDIYRNTSGGVKAGYVQQAAGQSEYNAFTSEIMRNAMSAVGTVVTVAFEDILFSKGTIAIQGQFGAVQGAGSSITDFNWDEVILAPGQSVADTFVAIGYNTALKQWSVVFTPETRADAFSTVQWSFGVGGAVLLHVWGFFVNVAGNKTSDSQHVQYSTP